MDKSTEQTTQNLDKLDIKEQGKGKNVLVVYAHPNPKSYTAAIRDLTIETLKERGFNIKTSDLYEMNFNPVASHEDFEEIGDKNYFNLMVEQKAGKLKNELVEETKKLLWCDYLIAVFPFWWSSPPAILNGWFDRVLACGIAWDFGGYKFDNGLLKGKKGMIITSVGSPDAVYKKGQLAKHTVKRRLFFVSHGTYGFCGMIPLEPVHLHEATSREDNKRSEELQRLKNILNDIENLPGMDYKKVLANES